jgi:hypothetical protein
MSIQELQASLQNLIQQPFSLSQLEQLLGPIPLYTNNSVFQTNMSQVIAALTKDRNADGKFTVDDLVLFSKDIIGMMSLISSLLLIISSIPNVKITYTEEQTEQLVFKLLVYVFLVIIPQKTSLQLTMEQKSELLNISLMVYQILIESGLVKKVLSKIAGWIKSGWTMCMNDLPVIEQKLPKYLATIEQTILHIKSQK